MSINSIGPAGLTIQTIADVVNEILNGDGIYPGLLQIYGAALNYNPNSPDGNMVNIYAQGKIDCLELIAQVNSQFDPAQAVGVNLDRCCGYVGVARQAGTFTIQPVAVTFSASATLPGLDLNPIGGAFTVQDSTGNQYALITTFTSGGSETDTLLFQAVNIGAVSSALNTITVINTNQIGVVSCNNPAAATILGVNEEADSALRIRFFNSVAVASIGYYDGLRGALLNIPGVTSVNIVENDTTGTVGGVPANSIWVIVSAENTADMQAAIAQAIYVSRNGGCGMYGGVSVQVARAGGTFFTIDFDFSTSQPLYFRCSAAAVTGTINKTTMANAVLQQFGNAYQINQQAVASAIVAFLQDQFPNASITNEAVSVNGSSWVGVASPTGVNYQFTIPSVATYIVIS